MKDIVYLFPGQGAQYIGMGKAFYESSDIYREVIDTADMLLEDIPLKELCFNGPEDALKCTSHCQLAIFATSIATLRVLEAQDLPIRPVACAGLSLGEMSANVAAGTVSFEVGVKLVRERALLMEEASRRNPGGIVSIIGLDETAVRTLCKETGCYPANFNSPLQIAVSGSYEALDRIQAAAPAAGAKMAVRLAVGGAFHSPAMNYASVGFGKILEDIDLAVPRIKLISNVTAQATDDPCAIRANLAVQMEKEVLWSKSMASLAGQGMKSYIELGVGKVLKGLMRRIDKESIVYNIEKPEDLTLVIEKLGA